MMMRGTTLAITARSKIATTVDVTTKVHFGTDGENNWSYSTSSTPALHKGLVISTSISISGSTSVPFR